MNVDGAGGGCRDDFAGAGESQRVRVESGRRVGHGRAVRLRQVAGDRSVRGRHRGRDRRQRHGVRDRRDAPAHEDRHQLLHREPGVQRRADGDAVHSDDVRLQRPRPLLAVRRHALPRRLLLTGHHFLDDLQYSWELVGSLWQR